MVKLAIVILNWNGKKHLEEFLPSVLSNSTEADEVVVVDNDSSDDSVLFLQAHYPSIRLIQNNSNGGFAQGYNDGLLKVIAEYYLLLNSDVEVTPGWLKPLITLMDSDHSIAACQPKIKSYLNKNLFEHAGASGGFIDLFAYPFCRGRILHVNEQDEQQYDSKMEVFWASGACMFVRSTSFWEAGAFDADYFAHMEEIDLCWRMKNLGYKIYTEPASTVYHLGGGTLNYNSPRKTYLNFRNSLFTLYKNSHSKNLYLIIYLRMVIDGIAALKFMTEGKFIHFSAVFKAHLNFYKNIGKLNQKRSKLINKKSLNGMYSGSIVFDFYLKGKKKFSSLKL
jgi:GT2 family glycosyltransferase